MLKVLIASHLNCEKRYKTIEHTLRSIANNSIKPDEICISYSFALHAPNTNLWKRICNSVHLTLLKQNTKLSQFEHYEKLLDHVNDDDILMFCDDDDLYDIQKIERVYWFFFAHPKSFICRHRHLNFTTEDGLSLFSRPKDSSCSNYDQVINRGMFKVVETKVLDSPKTKTSEIDNMISREYWDYSVKGFKWKEAFEELKSNPNVTLNNRVVDLTMSAILEDCIQDFECLDEIVYYYRHDLYSLRKF